ncbi:toxin biosynthesis protein [Penicillium angulare]|uniref:toxin biosynthesis protein n=1 Tax=Penicillium angulare TaxID=116970 RepID=UPI0025401F67|nr:toxin biosynthesis protein [Penicillium angulare]KAJ5263440.1 toxin biosynthesis protein [Penicillium angulare]
MASTKLKVIEHSIPCQSIREYHRAGKRDSPSLQLAIKQYIPLNNTTPGPDDVTIIAGHANGIPKECYEPIWEELLSSTSVKIKAIWIADSSNQGASGVMNENELGDDPNWFDHSRDLLYMVNHFRDQIQAPIMGIAHSFGCSQFVHLSIMHPRLFQSLVFIDPMIQNESPSKIGGPSPALWTSRRPDFWPSAQDAEKHIRGNGFWRKWDPKCVDQYIRFGLRPAPTALYPNSDSGAVTLTTTKAQEAWSYLRLNATPQDEKGEFSKESFLNPDLAKVPREGDNNHPDWALVCPWCCIAFEYLLYVRPPVLYIFGERSHINPPERRADKLERTGKGLGGSGGVPAGRVRSEILSKGSHMAPLEKVHDTAQLLSGWLESQIKAYRAEKDFWNHHESGKSEQNGVALSKQWMKYVQQPVETKRAIKSNL